MRCTILLDKGCHKQWRGYRGPTPWSEPIPDRSPDIVPDGGCFTTGSYTNHAGTRSYKLYIPSGWHPFRASLCGRPGSSVSVHRNALRRRGLGSLAHCGRDRSRHRVPRRPGYDGASVQWRPGDRPMCALSCQAGSTGRGRPRMAMPIRAPPTATRADSPSWNIGWCTAPDTLGRAGVPAALIPIPKGPMPRRRCSAFSTTIRRFRYLFLSQFMLGRSSRDRRQPDQQRDHPKGGKKRYPQDSQLGSVIPRLI
jgi:hypothetical protein